MIEEESKYTIIKFRKDHLIRVNKINVTFIFNDKETTMRFELIRKEWRKQNRKGWILLVIFIAKR